MAKLAKLIFLVCCVLNTVAVCGQTGKLQIEYTLNKLLIGQKDKIRISFFIVKGSSQDETNHLQKDGAFEKNKNLLVIDSLPTGNYKVCLRGSWDTIIANPGGEFDCMHSVGLKDTVFSKVVIQSNQTTKIKTVFPCDCRYYQGLHHNTCPKCHKNDKVIFIGYGDPVVDPTISCTEFHESLKESTGCDPVWYCKRDKLEF